LFPTARIAGARLKEVSSEALIERLNWESSRGQHAFLILVESSKIEPR